MPGLRPRRAPCAGGRFGWASRWRLNCLDVLANGWGVTKLASFPGFDDRWLTDLPLTEILTRVAVRKLAVVTGMPWLFYNVAPPDTLANFPYGFTVEPDH